MADHDMLILMKAQLDNLTVVIAQNNNASVERDARIETKVDRINGTVQQHKLQIQSLDARPVLPISADETETMAEQNRELWTVYRIGRWIVAAGVLALLGQTAALITVIARGG